MKQTCRWLDMPYAICRMPYVIWSYAIRIPYAIRHMPYTMCHMSYTVCHTSYAVCHMPYSVCHMVYAWHATLTCASCSWDSSESLLEVSCSRSSTACLARFLSWLRSDCTTTTCQQYLVYIQHIYIFGCSDGRRLHPHRKCRINTLDARKFRTCRWKFEIPPRMGEPIIGSVTDTLQSNRCYHWVHEMTRLSGSGGLMAALL